MRWLIGGAAVLAVVVALVLAVGYMLPVRHVASRQIALSAPLATVWQAITDVPTMPRWRGELKGIEVVSGANDKLRWRETSNDGAITFEVVESVPLRRLVSRIADEKLPFGGSWTYELTPNGSGTTLTIREDGEVYHPVYRFVSRFVLGHHATMDRYVSSLQRHLGA